MARQQKDFTFDGNMVLKDAGLVAASGAATVGGVAKVINLGGANRIDARAVINVSAIDVAGANELYTVLIQASSSPPFATDVVNLPAELFGPSPTTLDT